MNKKIIKFFRSIPPIVYIIFAISVLVRVLVLIFIVSFGGQQELLWGDSLRYQELGHNILEGNGFLYKDVPDAYRPPGYPIFFLIIEALHVPLWLASLFQIFIASLIPVIAYYLARRFLVLSKRWSVIAAIFCALEPIQVYYSVALLPDVFFTVLFLLTTILLLEWLQDPYWRPMMWAGVLLGVANYIRPAGLYIAIAILFFFSIYIWRKKIPYIKFLNLGLLALTMFVVMVPWYVRNYIEYNEVGFVSAGAYNLYIYAAASTKAIATGETYDFVREALGVKLLAEAPDPKNRSSLANQDYLLKNSKEILKMYPVAYAKSVALGLNTFLFSGNYHYLLYKNGIVSMPERISFSLFLAKNGVVATFAKASSLFLSPYFFTAIVGKMLWVIITLGSLVGAYMYRHHKLAFVFLVFFAYFSFTIVGVGIGVEARHRYALNPLIFLFFTAMISHIYDRYIRRRSSL